MEITCTRCHQTVQVENSYCPACGLPQLVYTADEAREQTQPELESEVVRDASRVDWKKAVQVALMLAVPAGLLCSLLSPLGVLVLPVMSAAGAWVVAVYLRSQRPAWITSGAGRPHRFVDRGGGRLDGRCNDSVHFVCATFCFSSGRGNRRLLA